MGPELVKVKQEAAISKTEDIADGELEVSRTFEEPADCEQQCKRSQSLGPDGVSLGLRAFLTELRAMNLVGDPIEPEDKVKLGLQMFLAEQRRRPGPVSALNVSPKSRVRLLPPVRVFRPEHQIDDVQTCKHEEFQEVLECDPDTQLSVNHCHTDAGSNGLEARDDELDSLSSTSEGHNPCLQCVVALMDHALVKQESQRMKVPRITTVCEWIAQVYRVGIQQQKLMCAHKEASVNVQTKNATTMQ